MHKKTGTIRTKQIAIADTEALRDALDELHMMIHTPEGLHAWSESRRSLIEHGMKAIKIAQELVRRGSIPTPCRFCLPDIRAEEVGLSV